MKKVLVLLLLVAILATACGGQRMKVIEKHGYVEGKGYSVRVTFDLTEMYIILADGEDYDAIHVGQTCSFVGDGPAYHLVDDSCS
jgi:hypothetical protein